MAATQYTFDLSIGFLKDKVALPKEYTGATVDNMPSSINEEKQLKNDFGLINIPNSLVFPRVQDGSANILRIDEKTIAKERDIEKQKVLKLIEAIQKNDNNTFTALINTQNVNINGYPIEGLVPIVETIRHKRWDMLETLREKKANLNVEYEDGKTVRNFLSEKNMDAVINKMSKLKISTTDIPVVPKISRSTTV